MRKYLNYVVLFCGMFILNGATVNYYKPLRLDGVVIIKFISNKDAESSYWMQDMYYYSNNFENGIQITNSNIINTIVDYCELYDSLTLN